MDTTNPSNPTIGPIPLPAFIAICIFAPSFVGVSCWVVYRHTIKKYLDRKRYSARDVEMARVDAGGEMKVSEDVEKQVRGFVDVPLR
jgi:hypothetical protein